MYPVAILKLQKAPMAVASRNSKTINRKGCLYCKTTFGSGQDVFGAGERNFSAANICSCKHRKLNVIQNVIVL